MGRSAAVACALAALACALPVDAEAAGPAPLPYGQNDAGGFHDVLPPGTRGLDNAIDLFQYNLSGKRPPHWMDQLPLYRDLSTRTRSSPTLRSRRTSRTRPSA